VLARAWLVISVDAWNETLQRYVAIPLQEPRGMETPFTPRVTADGVHHLALVGRLTPLFPAHLASAQAALAETDLATVETAIGILLALSTLFSGTPTRPRPPAGRITYPLWGELYYVGPRIGGELKRFVCVSTNEWNRADNSALFVRTTSQPKRSTVWFPHIEGGRAQAACGDIAFAPSARVLFNERPPRPLVSLGDMQAVARGLIEVLGLRP
jgi:hypothetical protein